MEKIGANVVVAVLLTSCWVFLPFLLISGLAVDYLMSSAAHLTEAFRSQFQQRVPRVITEVQHLVAHLADWIMNAPQIFINQVVLNISVPLSAFGPSRARSYILSFREADLLSKAFPQTNVLVNSMRNGGHMDMVREENEDDQALSEETNVLTEEESVDRHSVSDNTIIGEHPIEESIIGEPELLEPVLPEPQLQELRIHGTQLPEIQAPVPQLSESQIPEPRVSETQVSEPRLPEPAIIERPERVRTQEESRLRRCIDNLEFLDTQGLPESVTTEDAILLAMTRVAAENGSGIVSYCLSEEQGSYQANAEPEIRKHQVLRPHNMYLRLHKSRMNVFRAEDPDCAICFMPLVAGEAMVTHDTCRQTIHAECFNQCLPHRSRCPFDREKLEYRRLSITSRAARGDPGPATHAARSALHSHSQTGRVLEPLPSTSTQPSQSAVQQEVVASLPPGTRPAELPQNDAVPAPTPVTTTALASAPAPLPTPVIPATTPAIAARTRRSIRRSIEPPARVPLRNGMPQHNATAAGSSLVTSRNGNAARQGASQSPRDRRRASRRPQNEARPAWR